MTFEQLKKGISGRTYSSNIDIKYLEKNRGGSDGYGDYIFIFSNLKQVMLAFIKNAVMNAENPEKWESREEFAESGFRYYDDEDCYEDDYKEYEEGNFEESEEDDGVESFLDVKKILSYNSIEELEHSLDAYDGQEVFVSHASCGHPITSDKSLPFIRGGHGGGDCPFDEAVVFSFTRNHSDYICTIYDDEAEYFPDKNYDFNDDYDCCCDGDDGWMHHWHIKNFLEI